MTQLLLFAWTTVLLIMMYRPQRPPPQADDSSRGPGPVPSASLPKQYLGVHADQPSSPLTFPDRQWFFVAVFSLALILSIPYLTSYLQARIWRPSPVVPDLSHIDFPNQRKSSTPPDDVSRTRAHKRRQRPKTPPSPPETAAEQGWRRVLFGDGDPSPSSAETRLEASRRKRRAVGDKRKVKFVGGLEEEEKEVEDSEDVFGQGRSFDGVATATEGKEKGKAEQEEQEDSLGEDEVWLKEWGWPTSSGSSEDRSDKQHTPESDDDEGFCDLAQTSSAAMTDTAIPRSQRQRQRRHAIASPDQAQIDIEDALANFVLSTDIPAPRRRQLREDYADSLLVCPRHYRVVDYRKKSRAKAKGKGRPPAHQEEE